MARIERDGPASAAHRRRRGTTSTEKKAAPFRPAVQLLMRRAILSLALLLPLSIPFSCCSAQGLEKKFDDCTPTEVHLALTDSPDTLRLLWASASGDCSPGVQIGALRDDVDDEDAEEALRDSHNSPRRGRRRPSASSPLPPPPLDDLFSFVSADVAATLERASYSSSDLCGPPSTDDDQTFESGKREKHFYAVELGGLRPSNLHAYRLIAGDDNADDDAVVEATFRAPPAASSGSGATVFVFGDMGDALHPRGKDPGAAVVARAVAEAVDGATWRREGEGSDETDGDDDDDSEDLSSSQDRSRTGRKGGDRPESFPPGGPPLVLHVGDISYADGDPRSWERFMAQVEGSAARSPYGVAAGNHDVGWEKKRSPRVRSRSLRSAARLGEDDEESTDAAVRDAAGFSEPYQPNWGIGPAEAAFGPDSRGECGVPTAARFSAFAAPKKRAASLSSNASSPPSPPPSCFSSLGRPRPPPPEDVTEPVRPFWYAFDHGPIHFVVVSTEHSLERGSRQRAWLESHLGLGGGGRGGIDRCRTPFVVLAAHRPMYVPRPHKANRLAGEELRKSLEPLVDAAGFDLVLSGHVHSFARSCNAAGLRCVPRSSGGSVHYTLGCGGRKLSGVEGVESQPEWIARAEDKWGFLRIDADGRSGRLTASFVRAEDGSVGDRVVIYSSERPPAHACREEGRRASGRRGRGESVEVA